MDSDRKSKSTWNTASTEKWFSPSGEPRTWHEILSTVQSYQRPGQTLSLWVGTDSHLVQHKFVFATVLVLCVDTLPLTRLYWVRRSKVAKGTFGPLEAKDALRRRLEAEIHASVDLSLRIEARTGLKPVIHCDLNASELFKSGRYAKQLTNYVKGCGFEFEIKPDAWAAAGVADKHSK